MSKQSSNSSLEPIGPKYHRLSIKLDYSSVDDCRQCRQTSMDLLCAVNDRRCMQQPRIGGAGKSQRLTVHATGKDWRCMQRPRIDNAGNSQRLTVQATANDGRCMQQARIDGACNGQGLTVQATANDWQCRQQPSIDSEGNSQGLSAGQLKEIIKYG